MGTINQLSAAPCLILFIVVFVACTQLLPYSITARPTSSPRPDSNQNAKFARWFVNQCKYGVLANIDFENAPFGNVMSYSDGATGVPYFFLTTTRDPTGMYARSHHSH
ncbi:hypothetical protein CASFOL_020210 [Castilleja foliolosa]|uniref:CREG-like beta-barrel domain-containing protein n=1 Tax=Castilleja foliolosa TaxID=1961234 RepID=A0ABD3D077_9LAMI